MVMLLSSSLVYNSPLLDIGFPQYVPFNPVFGLLHSASASKQFKVASLKGVMMVFYYNI